MSVIAEALVRLRPDTTTFKAEAAAGVSGAIGGIGLGGADKSFIGVGKSALKMTAGIAGITTATTVAAIGLREIIVGAANVERELDVLKVVSGATADEMERVGETARQLGADVSLPGISAGDAAVAMNELAKAGLSIQDTIGGARGVLQLAAAGELEVRDAAALAGGALNAFGLEGEKASHVADLLAGASIAAQGDVSDMGLALQQAGAVARQAGLSVEQTVGAIALLAKNGILGSDAGTSLRTTLLRLIPTTKEAAQFTNALGIEIDGAKTLGEQFPEVIDQYRSALSKLSPELQQVALTQIFGSDAIRAASIFAREGAEGYDEMTGAVNRTGAANELATARTEGLLGTFEGLKSQLSTLAESLGEEIIPGLQETTAELSNFVGGVTDVIEKLKELNEIKLDKLPGFGGQDDADNDDDDLGRLKFLGDLADKINEVLGFEKELADARAKRADKRSPDVIDRAQVVNDLRVTGAEAGNQFVSKVREEILAVGPTAVEAARAMAAQVGAAGKAAIQQAIAGAQQNLASLGSQLASAVGEIIDSNVEEGVASTSTGGARAISSFQRRRMNEAISDAKAELARALENVPVMREIERIQAQLDRMNRADDRTDIRRGLRDANEELALAQRQAQTAGKLDPRQAADRRKFLRPFVEAVQDAKGEVKKFSLEARLDKAQKRLDEQTDDIAENIERLRDSLRSARESLIESQREFATGGLTNSLQTAATAQKRAVTQGIDDAVQAFNDGLITLPQLNKRLAKLLEDNEIDYANAGKKLGTAFVRRFNEVLKGIGAQGADILAGPQDPGAGIRATRTIPAAVARTAALNNEQAQRALAEALVTQGEDTNGYLARIARAVEDSRQGRPSASVGDSAADKANTAVQVARKPKPKPRSRYADLPGGGGR